MMRGEFGMRAALVTSMVVMLTLLPAAQPGVQGQDNERQILTFKLTINGDVPPGQAFQVVYGPRPMLTASIESLCGERDLLANPDSSEGLCKGGGATYTRSFEFPFGSDEMHYKFERIYRDKNAEGGRRFDFFAGTDIEYVPANGTYTTTYTYPGKGGDEQDGGRDDEQGMPDELPETGAGGMEEGDEESAHGVVAVHGAARECSCSGTQ